MQTIRAPRVLLGCAAGAAVIGVLVVLPTLAFFHPRSDIATRQMPQGIGIIRQSPTLDKLCREFEFNNYHGEIRDKGVHPCEPRAEPGDWVNAIRNSFRGEH
jgi:hypothetical protein